MYRFLCAIAFVFLAGCGGADSSPKGNTPNGDLALSFSYSSVAWPFERFSPLSIKPNVGQLGKNKPHFKIVSGRLPDGLQLNEHTGEISGVPTSVQNYASLSIAISVEGFSGELKSSFVFSISDRNFYYGPTVRLQLGETIPSKKLTPGSWNAQENPQPNGAKITFSIDPATPLPAGLNLNTATGEISGTPTELSPTAKDVNIRIAVNYNGVSYPYSAVASFIVYAPMISVNYARPAGSSDFYVRNGMDFNSGAPRIVQGFAGDRIDDFQLVPNHSSIYNPSGTNSLPPGLVFDPATGVISGVPAAPHTLNRWGNPCTPSDLQNRSCPQQYWTSVSATFHRGAYSQKIYIDVFFRVE